MAEEVVIKFIGDSGSLVSSTKQITGEVKTLADLFAKMSAQGKTAYLETAKGATQLAQTLGSSFRNAKEFAASIGLSAKAANEAAQRLGELDRAGASTTEKFRALKSEFGLTKKAFTDLNASFNQNTKAQQELAQSLGLSIGQARNFAKDIGLSASKANEAVGRYRELSQVGATLAEKQRVLTQELGLTDKQFTAVRGSALATREGLAAIAGVAGGVAAALGAIGSKGIATFTEFDQIIRTFGVISEGSAAQVGLVRDEVERLGITTTKTPKEVAALSVELAKAGFKSEQVKDALGGIVLASQATGEDLARTGEVVGNVINQFGLAAKDSANIADLLVATSNASASGVNDLGEALSYTGTAAAQSGQSLQDTLFVLGQLANAGIKGSSAGTGFAEALRRLKLASANAGTEFEELQSKGAKGAIAAFEKVNKAVRGANGQLLPMPQILENLKAGLVGVSQVDKDLIMNALFGVQGGRVIQTLIAGNAEQVGGLKTALDNYAGSATRAGEALSQGPAAAIQRVQASFDIALISIGEFLSAGFLPLIDVSETLLNTFNSLPGPLQGAIVAVGALAAALAAAVAAITAYKLSNAGLIIQQAIASAGILKDTVLKGANTAATLLNAGAQGQLAGSYALLGPKINAAAIATRAWGVVQSVSAAASTAWAAVTSGALVPAITSATASMGGLVAASLPFIVLAAAIGGAVILMQEAFRKTDQEKFADDIRKSTEEVRKLRGETTKATDENVFDGLAESYDKFGQRIKEGGVISALQKTLVDLSATFGLGADAADKFGQDLEILGFKFKGLGNNIGIITREQLGAQQATLALGERLDESAKFTDKANQLLTKYGLITLDAGDKQRLGAAGIAEYNKAAGEQVKAIEAEIEALSKLSKGANGQDKATLDTQIAGLEKLKGTLQKRSAALTQDSAALKTNTDKAKEAEAAQKKLEETLKRIEGIGNKAEKGATSGANAEAELNKIASASGAEVEVKRKASAEIIKIRQAELSEIETLIKTGEITEAEGQKRIAAIAASTNSKGAKQAAAEADLKIRKGQIDAEIAAIQAGQSAIDAAVANGLKSQAQADQEVTELKLQEIDKRIAANLAEQAVATGSGKSKLISEAKQLEAERSKVQGEQAKKRRALAIEDFDEQLKVLEASYAKQQITQEQFEQRKQQLQTKQADTEIGQLKEQLAKLSASDKEGREKILAQIADVEVKRAKIQEDAFQKYLARLKENQDKALAIVNASEKERLISIQQSANAGAISQEEADKLRVSSSQDRIREELALAEKAAADLEKVSTKGLSPEAVKQVEKEKQAARQQTLDLTLSLLQSEQQAQEAARAAAIAAIEREGSTTLRRIDQQIAGIERLKQSREQSARSAEAASQREAAAIDLATKSLDRQNALITAKANLQKAQTAAAQGETSIELDKIKRAQELKRIQESGSPIEQAAAAAELAKLGIDTATTQLGLLQQQQALETKLNEQKRAALVQEQAQATQALQLEIQRNDLANKRQLLEAQIAESKARAAIVDAQIAQQEQAQLTQRELAEARIAKLKAQQLAPGAERNQAIAEADAQLSNAQAAGSLGAQGAAQSVGLAQQQLTLAQQNTAAIQQSVVAEQQINQLRLEAQSIEQKAALRQLDAANAAALNAQSLQQASLYAQQIAAAAEREKAARDASTQATQIKARFTGGPVSPGQLYTIAERGPELVNFSNGKSALVQTPGLYTVPSSGHVHNARETARMMSAPIAKSQGSKTEGGELLQEVKKLRSTIKERKQLAAQINVGSGDNPNLAKVLRSITRGNVH